ncbi:copper-binding transcription factor [Metarhizium rileyi]|uniref:Copper-binding transcription factor n=1 Tax=Metarhizium rileyi (strain RCEF 4871) TaxID=1649241 RepID=A0A5C6GF95_METRR|nr:copper-binding transcription factor [Metarhizium rileyi]
MSSANPRRRTSGRDAENGLALKTTMVLRKGATFHSPTYPASLNMDDAFVPPQLSRSQTNLDDVVDANRRRIALTLSEIDDALARTEHHSLSPKAKKKTLGDTSIPVPRGLFGPPIVDPAMANPELECPVLRPRSMHRSAQQASDSGLGSSIVSSDEKREAAQTLQKIDNQILGTGSALGGSGACTAKGFLPALSQKAFNRIHEHTLRPLLEKTSLNDFKPILDDVPRRIRSKDIICLRDLEKSLLFMAPKTAKSAASYLDFCFTSIRCIQATVEYLTDREQVRPGDRPFTYGYFIDLKEQIYQYARQLAASREKDGSADDMDVDQDDGIRLYGGIAESGRPAELIRVRKDGSAVSIATGKPVELCETRVTFKRSLSEQREDEEEIMRSMARRKKNATAEELAPKKCREPGCNKEFKRPCDLTKHEKTHSRPWKCPHATCKYHEFGWPTEKEMDRHVNDKHSDAPAMYECLYKPCPYKSKRESNCKQHMEKAHGWNYIRTKTNGKKSSVQQTPPLGNVSTPSSTPTYSVPTPPQDHDAIAFPTYQADSEWLAAYGLETVDGMELTVGNTSPSSATSYDSYPPYQNGSTFILTDEDIYAAHMQLPTHLQAPQQLYNKTIPQQMPVYRAQDCPAPGAQVPPHFSPSGHENAMLFTPTSLRGVDEGFDEAYNGDGSDFQLFPCTSTNKNSNHFQQSLFSEAPSANLGFSQVSQPGYLDEVDWTSLDF